MIKSPPSESRPPKRMGILCLAILTCVFAQTLLSFTTNRIPVHPSAIAGGDRVAELLSRIDPNHAPWWELAQLPGIGQITAQRIVDHRQTATPPAFHQLADLDPIKNIGPVTLRKIEPYLIFPSSTKKP